MTAATMQQTPAIPPRPSRSADKDLAAGAMPQIPPRPVNKRLERSRSPNADRFAPSPFNGGIISKNSLSPYHAHDDKSDDPIERAGSVNMPSVGEEGAEYSAVAEELEHEQETKSRSSSPEQTRTVGEDLHLHAPKPSLPAKSAKQRVMAVTRTDSDRAASYGIGKPTEDRVPSREGALSRNSAKKRTSSVFSGTSDHGQYTDDEHGIPEIGQRVPMNPHLGDVQAPSPGPSEGSKRHHHRKTSSRGLPPGSYGLHGHGVAPQDKLEKVYYEKHPDLLEKEHHNPIHDRQNDFAMSSSDLNKLVRDTASRGSGMGASADSHAIPTDEAAFQASEEYTSRISSPRPASTAPKADAHGASNLKQSFQAEVSEPDGNTIHVEDSKHPEFRSYGQEGEDDNDRENDYSAPILAADETVKGSSPYLQQPAVHPAAERRGSAFEMDDTPSQPSSRPSSVHLPSLSREFDSTPLEDVKEYEPLFPDEQNQARQKQDSPDEAKLRRHFPSKDIWEDAPNSVHFTTEVMTPDMPETSRRKSSTHSQHRPITPAQAFALHQEELAERENKKQSNSFLPLSEDKPKWVAHQPHLKAERPHSAPRFPSRDIWEDVPESQLHQAVVSGPQEEEEKEEDIAAKPDVPTRPTKKASDPSSRPSVPDRPRPKQSPVEEVTKTRPPISEKPKPMIPARPSKSSPSEAKEGEVSKPKPPVPSRPVGGKIAALQAGFMSDLNKRLQIGPQAVKKEEPEQQDLTEEKEKAPLSDARKGRARGPQRRAPAKSPVPAAVPAVQETKPSVPSFTFSMPLTTWAIDPDEGDISVQGEPEKTLERVPTEEAAPEPVTEPISEPVPEPVKAPEPQVTEASIEAATEVETKAPEVQASEEPEKVEEPTAGEPAKEEKLEDKTEEKTLVANMAGESILEEQVKKDDGGVEPVAVTDEVKP